MSEQTANTSDTTEKGTAKKSAVKKDAAKKSATKKSSAKKTTRTTAKKETSKKDTVKKTTVKKDSTKKDKIEESTPKKKASPRKRAARAKVEIVDTTESGTVDAEPIVTDPLMSQPIVIDDSTRGSRTSRGSGERHGGFLNMLYRHPSQRMVSGVCGGIADYLGWDAMIVRALWVVASLMTAGAAGLLAYAVLSLLLPVGTKADGFIRPGKIDLTEENMRYASYALIGVGALVFLSNIGVLSYLFAGARAVIGLIFWPAVLVTVGLLLLNRNGDKNYQAALKSGLNTVRERATEARASGKLPQGDTIRESFLDFRNRMPLKRSRNNRIVAGVCGGIGRAVDIDANLVRLGFAVATVVTAGTPILVYVLLAALLPSDGGPKVRQEDIIIKDEVIIKDEDISVDHKEIIIEDHTS